MDYQHAQTYSLLGVIRLIDIIRLESVDVISKCQQLCEAIICKCRHFGLGSFVNSRGGQKKLLVCPAVSLVECSASFQRCSHLMYLWSLCKCCHKLLVVAKLLFVCFYVYLSALFVNVTLLLSLSSCKV